MTKNPTSQGFSGAIEAVKLELAAVKKRPGSTTDWTAKITPLWDLWPADLAQAPPKPRPKNYSEAMKAVNDIEKALYEEVAALPRPANPVVDPDPFPLPITNFQSIFENF